MSEEHARSLVKRAWSVAEDYLVQKFRDYLRRELNYLLELDAISELFDYFGVSKEGVARYVIVWIEEMFDNLCDDPFWRLRLNTEELERRIIQRL